MNKSKFLKRSLAALLAILMVVAMVPMSAFAAPVALDDAQAVTDDPGYVISVGTQAAVWQDGAYVVNYSHENNGTDNVTGVTISMIKKNGVQVNVREDGNKELSALAQTLDMTKATKTNAGSYGAGTYTFTLDILTIVGDQTVESSCPLVINVTVTQPSGDTSIHAVKDVAGMVSYKVDSEKEEVTVVMALNVDISSPIITSADKFVVDANATATVNGGGKTVTVKAKNDDAKTYSIKYVHEAAFSSFSLSDDEGNVYEGTIDESNPKQVVIDLPYEYFDDSESTDAKIDKITAMKASWTTAKTSHKVGIADAFGNVNSEWKTSGKETLNFDTASSADNLTDLKKRGDNATGYVVLSTSDAAADETKVFVKTKKTATLSADSEVDIIVRVPTENPDAKLTGIQIMDAADGGVDSQYFAVPAHSGSGVQDIKITLPNGVSKDDIAKISVWGAVGSDVEIALDKPAHGTATGGIFGSADGTPLTLDANGEGISDEAINFSKPVTVGVTSEDGETTLLYRLVVSETESTARNITDIKLIDPATQEEVGTVKQEGTNITITVPFAVGNDANVLKLLELYASASPSARIDYHADNDGTATFASVGSLVKCDTLETLFGATVVAGDAADGNNGTKNVSVLRVWFGDDADAAAEGEYTDYVVTLLKEAPETNAYINSAELISPNATKTTDADVVTYTAAVSSKNATNKTITTTVPYARKGDTTVKFSKLDVSTGAVVLMKTPGAATYARVTLPDVDANEPSTDVDVLHGASNANLDWTGATSAAAVKNVELIVVSESEWNAHTPSKENAVTADEIAAFSNTGKNTYKMSATVTSPVSTASLRSVSAPLDPNVDVSVDRTGKQINISVPASYVGDATARFSLNIQTGSPLNRVYVNATEVAAKNYNDGTSPFSTDGTPFHATNNAAVKRVISDEGSEDVADATEFKVVKAGQAYQLQNVDDSNTVAGVLVVAAEKHPDSAFEAWTVKVTAKAVETSAEITSITAAGRNAVLNGTIWTLTVPEGTDMEQKLNISTKANVVNALDVDGAEFDANEYYDLSNDIPIFVQSEDGLNEMRYTLKTVVEGTAASDDASLSSVTVGDYTVTKSGNEYTVTVPEDTDVTALPVAITATDSKVQSITVNGEAYTAGMTVNLTEPATIVVTAEDGSTATYTLTVSFGTTPPDPDKKPSDNYTDIPAGAMGEAVKAAIDQGIMVGTSSTKFSPNLDVTRWQFALLIARADLRVKNSSITTAEQADAELMNQYSGTPKFDDTKNLKDLYNAAIEYCNKNGIVDGIGNNNFNPNGKVTRLMAARMISDWAGVTDETLTENTNNIKDWSRVNWGKHYVNSVYAAGFMQGYPNGNFGPADNLTRGQSAVVIMKAFEYKSGNN